MIHSANLSFSGRYYGYLRCRLPAIIGIILLMLLPSDGLGINVCWFQMIFDLPCPACGLTRGMSSLLHFEFYKSLMYHPLGVLVLGYLFILALSNKPDFIKTIVKKKSESLAFFFSFKFIAALFIVFWIIKLFYIK